MISPGLFAVLSLSLSSASALPGFCSTLTCDGTVTSGTDNVALGQKTQAIGVQGDTAMGFHTVAQGSFSTAMGYGTTASALYSTAMGASAEATESEALFISGNVHSLNSFVYGADERLRADVEDVDADEALKAILGLHVVSHRPSDGHCKHMNLTAHECEGRRSVGILAQDVMEKIPGAVGSGGHLGLLGTEEKVEDLLGLDVHAMLSQLVSAVQAQAKEINKLKEEVEELRAGA